MPYVPSPLATHADPITTDRPAPPPGAALTDTTRLLLVGLRAQCAIVMFACGVLVCGHVAFAIYTAAVDDVGLACLILLCGSPWVLFGLVAWALFAWFGRMLRRGQA